MEPLLLFQVPGAPRGKARPRFRVVQPRGKSSFVSTYTPAETASYEAAVCWRAREALKGAKPLDGPLMLIITAIFEVPASWSKTKRAAALAHEIRPMARIDWDNIGKICCDALNKIVWNDDVQIVDGRVVKFYGETPFVQIEVLRP